MFQNSNQQVNDNAPLAKFFKGERYHNFQEYVEKSTAKDFFTPIKCVYSVKESDTVNDVLQILSDKRIQAVPVYNDQHVVRGFVDVFDMMSFIIKEKIYDVSKLNVPISQAFNFMESDFPFVLPDSTPLRELLYVLGSGKIYRVFVLNPTSNQITGIITQMKLLQHLAADLWHFPDLAGKTLSDLGLHQPHPVVSIEQNHPLREAFTTMMERDVRGLAVVNAAGSLVNTITASDVKGLVLSMDIFNDLEKPILLYLKKLRPHMYKLPFVIATNTQTHLLSIMKEMEMERIHRIFIVDEKQVPVGVVSVHDVLTTLWKFYNQ